MGEIVRRKWSAKDHLVNVSGYRWRLVFAKLLCQRAFLSIFKEVRQDREAYHPNRYKYALPEATHSINIDVDQTSPYFSEADQTNLSKLVKEKNVDQVNQVRGVEGFLQFLNNGPKIIDDFGSISKGYSPIEVPDIGQILEEAQHRWMSVAEVYEIIQNYQAFIIGPVPPDRPSSGSLFLFNRKVLRYFRQDGHKWRNRRGGKTVKEVHERLKVGTEEVLHCYHAHGEENENFQRRCYWLIEAEPSHIVLVHYLEIKKMHMDLNMCSTSLAETQHVGSESALQSSSGHQISYNLNAKRKADCSSLGHHGFNNSEVSKELDNFHRYFIEEVGLVEDHAQPMEAHTTNPGGHVNSEERNVDLISVENITNLVMGPVKGDRINISYEDLEQHFGKNLNEVAASIGVSRSTIKRICRDEGILRWPSHMRNKPSPFSRSRGCNTNPTSVLRRSPRRKVPDVQEDDGVLPHKNMESTIQDGGMVTIKASYENIIIKFQLSNVSNLVVLEQEVGKRLNFNVGDFKMEYQDEENDWVSILCDADLLFCFKSMNLLGNSIIRMKVRLCCAPS